MWACHIICGASPKIFSLALTLISVVESNKSLYDMVELVFTGETKKDCKVLVLQHKDPQCKAIHSKQTVLEKSETTKGCTQINAVSDNKFFLYNSD